MIEVGEGLVDLVVPHEALKEGVCGFLIDDSRLGGVIWVLPLVFLISTPRTTCSGMVMEQAYDSSEANQFIYTTCTGTEADGHNLLFFP